MPDGLLCRCPLGVKCQYWKAPCCALKVWWPFALGAGKTQCPCVPRTLTSTQRTLLQTSSSGRAFQLSSPQTCSCLLSGRYNKPCCLQRRSLLSEMTPRAHHVPTMVRPLLDVFTALSSAPFPCQISSLARAWAQLLQLALKAWSLRDLSTPWPCVSGGSKITPLSSYITFSLPQLRPFALECLAWVLCEFSSKTEPDN